ncbi:hypothetical protein RHS04_08833 [Rhizoctonia solani]|uniref:DUF2235 domain-containing protein n=1 Tax=Rhizoctonia solani TaxID=456999 RepID=A0A8H7H0J8_9AGAM|nr:hypothetical protein RHS04_08833 [Rhizoctonia solani]
MSRPKKDFDLELTPCNDQSTTGHLFVKVVEKNAQSRNDTRADMYFNLSTVVGADNGSLRWGGSGFEKTARDIRISRDRTTQNWVLEASVEDALGQTKHPKLILDDYLDVVEYYNPTTQSRRLTIALAPTGVGTYSGTGTYAGSGTLTRIGLNIAAKVDEATAWYLYQHIMDGYKFLMQTYQGSSAPIYRFDFINPPPASSAGDQIVIFGYSRGAYTARALAGMIHSVGLLPKNNREQIAFAYNIYRASADREQTKPTTERKKGMYEKKSIFCGHHVSILPGDQDLSRPENIDPADFKRTFCRDAKVHFVGVWDTVGSVGAFRRKKLPHVSYNPSVSVFRQALALDENRGNFIPSVWDHARTNESQNVLEVWFKGGHSDVGGGKQSIKEGQDPEQAPQLSDISLRWMVRECKEHTRVRFDPTSMGNYCRSRTLGESYFRKPGEEQNKSADHDLDLEDITPETYSMLDKSLMWKLLEWLPLPKPSQAGNLRLETVYRYA